jgi:hypothetical protein
MRIANRCIADVKLHIAAMLFETILDFIFVALVLHVPECSLLKVLLYVAPLPQAYIWK